MVSFCIVLVTWPLQPIVIKWSQNSHSRDFASWCRVDTTWMRCSTLGPIMLINRKIDIRCKLDILHNRSTFLSQLHQRGSWSFATQSHGHGGIWSIASKRKLKFCHTVPWPRGDLVGLAPPKQSTKPLNWNAKHYKTVIFVHTSENVKPHCTNVKPHYRKTFWWRFCCHTKLFISHSFGNSV